MLPFAKALDNLEKQNVNLTSLSVSQNVKLGVAKMLSDANTLINIKVSDVKQPKEQQPDNDLDVVNPSNYPTNARRVTTS